MHGNAANVQNSRFFFSCNMIAMNKDITFP